MKNNSMIASILAIGLAACGTKTSPLKETTSTAAGGDLTNPAASDPAAEFMDAMVEYGVATMTVPWNGNCEEFARDLLKIEPLTIKVKERHAVIDGHPDKEKLLERLKKEGPRTLTRMENTLKTHGLSMADVEAKESKVRATCRGNAAYEAAMPVIGLKRPQ